MKIRITRSDSNIILIFAGSLLFQTVQIGTYPILVSQILANKSVDSGIIGIFVAISWIPVLVFGPLVPRIIRIFGYGFTNFVAFVLTAVCFAWLLVFDDPISLLFSATCLGIGLIFRWISCDALIVHLSNAGTRGKTIGLHEALMGLGIGLGPLMFVVPDLTTITTICLGLSIAGQVAFYFADTSSATWEEGAREPHRRWFFLKAILVALAAAAVSGFIENSAIALFPLHFDSFGYSLAASAILVSSFGFGGTLLQPPLGYLADRKSYKFAQSVCIAAIVFSCAVVMIFPGIFAVMIVALFILGGAAGGLNTLAVIEAGQTLGKSKVPAAMTAIAMLYTLGSIVGPITSGAVLDILAHNGMVVLFCIAGVTLAAIVIAFQNISHSGPESPSD